MTTFPELGFYVLPGHVADPRAIMTEPSEGEALGLGSAWISERFGTKDVGVLSGAALARTDELAITAGLLGQLGLRHPVAIASYASTMAALSGDRFALGIGRGIDAVAEATGTPRVTFEYLGAFVDVLRQLWRGERVTHDSPVARLRGASLGIELESPPPIIMAAMGDRTCRWAGAHCDGVVLNSLWSPRAVERSVAQVRRGAEEAGRDPASVQVWAIVVTASDVSRETMLVNVVRRMNTYMYFPAFIRTLCEVNGWDPVRAAHVAATLREIDGDFSAQGGLGDEHTSRESEALERMYEAYPEPWILEGNAVGDAETCAAAYRERFDAGADSILIHGSAPGDLSSLLATWPGHRPPGLGDRSPVPGRGDRVAPS